MLDNLLVYQEITDRPDTWENYLFDKEKLNFVTAQDISKNPDGYILCFSFFDLKHLLDIKPDSGTYIYSSSEAFSEEQAIDFKKLKKWLDFLGIKPVGFDVQIDDGKVSLTFEHGYHASGHASKEEITRVIEAIDPDVIIPVHTTNSKWFEDRFGSSHSVKNLNVGERLTLN
jgi:ribonuclease J